MTGLGSLKGDLRGLTVANLPDDDHIRGLTKRGPQGGTKVEFIGAHFPLRHQGGRVLGIDILDGILETDHVFAAALGPVQDQRGNRGGLTTSGGATDEKESVLGLEKCFHRRRGNAHLIDGRDLNRQKAHDPAQLPASHQLIDPEPVRSKNDGVVQATRHHLELMGGRVDEGVVAVKLPVELVTQGLPGRDVEVTDAAGLRQLHETLAHRSVFPEVVMLHWSRALKGLPRKCFL